MKRIIALLLALCFIGPVPVHSAEAVYIKTEAELVALSSRVAQGDSMKGKVVCLTADISLTAPFIPIGSADAPFCGSFDGGGHTVRGLRVERAEGYNGLFGCIVGGGVKDLNVENAYIKGGDYSAVIAGRLYSYEGYSAISSCTVSGTVEGVCYVGGIVGLVLSAAHGIYSESVVADCIFDGAVNGDIYVGSISGKADAISTASRAESRIEGCVSYGTVRADGKYGTMVGGICGAVGAKSSGGSSIACVRECVSYSSSSADKAATGGVCGAVGADGYGANANVFKSVALGSTKAAALAGGVAGQSQSLNQGTVSVTESVAGGNIIGADIYPIASGEGVSGCFTPADKIVYPVEAEVPTYKKGDVGGDGAVDNADAALVLKHDAGLALMGVTARKSADVNGDGFIDNLDSVLILKYDAGIIEGI